MSLAGAAVLGTAIYFGYPLIDGLTAHPQSAVRTPTRWGQPAATARAPQAGPAPSPQSAIHAHDAVPSPASVPRGGAFPTPGYGEAPAPLGRPEALSARSASYKFLLSSPTQRFVAYDPCRPVHYVVRAANEPADGPALLQAAFARLSRATGLRFIDDGSTIEGPSKQRQMFQKARYGDRWAPVLITWDTIREEPSFKTTTTPTAYGYSEHTVLGLTGSSDAAANGHPWVYVTGQMKLNAAGLTAQEARQGPAAVQAVIEHELGHLVGLDHTTDPAQLMYPESGAGRLAYNTGDLTGLAQLGQGPCEPDL
ncbi:matrixin family metalloprotease [Paenarthrobacter sp. DKR-5]|uniref:matrixin family metalloprotease n=1 Tax=Paenarthrobacter sp. DKR-5 TaxID=2835535 RepID=UPI001BDCB755|nr:matrixin family metalloprotease [Paenarthrobacter sp. DKR-5]MBT1001994.1 matrixin family metalloprotease [Paenarthrobacter sp. DKR-5]